MEYKVDHPEGSHNVTFLWENVDGKDGLTLYVLKIGYKIHFFRVEKGAAYMLEGGPATIDLRVYKSSVDYVDQDVIENHVSFAYGDGRLIVVGPVIEPIAVEYERQLDGSAHMRHYQIDVRERDLEGIEDVVPIETTPATLTATHRYNLNNAGWNAAKITDFANYYGFYPSRAMDPWTGVVDEVNPKNGSVTSRFRPSMYRAAGDSGFGTTEAPIGRFIRDTFDTTVVYDTSGEQPITSIKVTATNPVYGADDKIEDWTSERIEVTVQNGWRESVLAERIQVGDTIDISGFMTSTAQENVRSTLALNAIYNVAEIGPLVGGVRKSVVLIRPARKDMRDYYKLQDNDPVLYDSADLTPDELEVSSMGTTRQYQSGSAQGVVEPKRFEAVGFFSGRVWYAGVQPEARKDLTGRLYFSQIVRTRNHLGRCYQAQDPTAKELNDSLDTDGGYLVINDLGTVHGMQQFQASLIVFTSNGVWQIGTDGKASPDSFTVRRISERGSRHRNAIFSFGGQPCYWSKQGLEIVNVNEVSGEPEVQSMTDTTIKRYIQEFVLENKLGASYDSVDNIGYWYFRRGPGAPVTVLVFDGRLGAFYPWSFDFGAMDVVGLYLDETLPRDRMVLVSIKGTGENAALTFYRPMQTVMMDTFAGRRVPFECHIESGHEVLDDALRRKQAIKVATMMERMERGSGLIAQGKYSWTDDHIAGKWTTPQQAYRDTGNGHTVSRSRLRMRGSGPSFRIRYSSDDGKWFKLYGWSVLYEGGNVI